MELVLTSEYKPVSKVINISSRALFYFTKYYVQNLMKTFLSPYV